MPTITTIPLNNNVQKRNLPKMGTYRVVIAEEICLTCGHRKRMQWVERVDGKRVLKEACLFCITKLHTKANREGI